MIVKFYQNLWTSHLWLSVMIILYLWKFYVYILTLHVFMLNKLLTSIPVLFFLTKKKSFITVSIIFSLSVSKKKSSYCDCCIVARSLLSSKNFNVAHYLKSIKGVNTKFGILAHHDKVQLQGKLYFWSYAPFN